MGQDNYEREIHRFVNSPSLLQRSKTALLLARFHANRLNPNLLIALVPFIWYGQLNIGTVSDLRRNIENEIRRRGDGQLLELLLLMTKSPNEYYRFFACEQLIYFQSETMIDALLLILESDDSLHVKRMAVHALSKFTRPGIKAAFEKQYHRHSPDRSEHLTLNYLLPIESYLKKNELNA